MLKYFRKIRSLLILVLFSGLFLLLGISIGRNHPASLIIERAEFNVVNNEISDDIVDMDPFWKVWNILDDKYVETKTPEATTTGQDRLWGAIQGMTGTLGDPYTVFLPPEDTKDFETNISGNFEGVGMEIGVKEGVLSVISPLKGSPAEKIGIMAGDKILTIDGKPAVDLSTDKAVKLIRGPRGTIVKIGILRNGNGKPLQFEIIRAVIDIPTAKTEIKDDVFIISLYNFYAQARPQFNIALKEFINSKKSKLILDLRGNPGGYLDAAVDMASWFLPLGRAIVREDFGDNKMETVYRSKGYDIFTDKLEMLILVDGGSASASEILAGALQEYGIAKLVGTKTYGKGSVQQLFPVTKDTSLKVTIAKWLTPNGNSISEGGLIPDYEVKITEEDLKAEKDPQMEKALELLAVPLIN